ncbi:hypothetical protein [Actinomyces glycerinitolerans]|uniref:Uncharacterized protein n=1 Tax=Actinomyces glycerinitolerans TaxID=1892869 RepID=A0A1M4RYJ4_9ACTO|nr:hypothetical protein [Actinomyces glycerinitolerans]SHE25046.1 Hypothetical protein ACGLYG10_1258 [Actinomyces glycerinitolerans]
MNPTTTDNNNSTRPTGATAQAPDTSTSRPRRRMLAVLLTITVLCAGALTWWHPWDQPEEVTPPETVCDGLYETAELDRILGSSIGDYWAVRSGHLIHNCTIQSGKPIATDARGYELDDAIVVIRYWPSDEYDAGNGVKWTDESMAADTENGVQKLDIPELEGNTYLWLRQLESENYVYGFWFGHDFTIVINLGDPENSLDGPKTTQEAMDVMPELLTYIVTQAQEHNAIPNPKLSKTPVSEPTDTADTPATDSTAIRNQPTSTPSAS